VRGIRYEGRTGPPLLLWNHRWEEDKNPSEFFRALYALDERGLEFEVAILGENFSKSPVVFEEARQRLGSRVAHYGFVKDYGEYARWLKRADILPVTSAHDFFGCSVVEAMYCGVYPILPRRLAYPEHFMVEEGAQGPGSGDDAFFYDDFSGLMERLERALGAIDETRRRASLLRERVLRYGWEQMAGVYDEELERAARRAGTVVE
jgi:glycosyltransferase involved in cell wall biosynthesis